MAQVTQDPQLEATVDHYLDYLLRTWESVPLDAREWEEWDEHSRFAYGFDWGVPDDRLHQLRGWSEQGFLTPAQRTRYDRLQELVTRYRPLLAKLLDDENY